jgi:hypothetical protein
MSSNVDTGEKPTDDSYNQSNNSKTFNQWGLPEGPEGAFYHNRWDISVTDDGLSCENIHSGYEVEATECCPGNYTIELTHFCSNGVEFCVPSSQWVEEIHLRTDDIEATLYQLCEEYSSLLPEDRFVSHRAYAE